MCTKQKDSDLLSGLSVTWGWKRMQPSKTINYNRIVHFPNRLIYRCSTKYFSSSQRWSNVWRYFLLTLAVCWKIIQFPADTELSIVTNRCSWLLLPITSPRWKQLQHISTPVSGYRWHPGQPSYVTEKETYDVKGKHIYIYSFFVASFRKFSFVSLHQFPMKCPFGLGQIRNLLTGDWLAFIIEANFRLKIKDENISEIKNVSCLWAQCPTGHDERSETVCEPTTTSRPQVCVYSNRPHLVKLPFPPQIRFPEPMSK